MLNRLSDKNLNEKEKLNLEQISWKRRYKCIRFILGELRKSSEKDQIIDIKQLEKYFLKSLTSRLKDYSSSKFEIVSSDKSSKWFKF